MKRMWRMFFIDRLPAESLYSYSLGKKRMEAVSAPLRVVFVPSFLPSVV
jgi:hypothetical protein